MGEYEYGDDCAAVIFIYVRAHPLVMVQCILDKPAGWAWLERINYDKWGGKGFLLNGGVNAAIILTVYGTFVIKFMVLFSVWSD